MDRPPRTLTVVILTCACALSMPERAPAHPGSGITVDDKGRVCFTDTGKGIWRIERGGKLTLLSGSAMHWMTIDRAGAFARAPEEFGEWFGRLTPVGEKPALISCSDFPCVMGTDGNLYFAFMHGLTIKRRTPEGRESVLASPEKFGVAAGRPIGVNGIACGPDGTIYLVSVDSVNKREGTGEHVLYAVGRDGSVRRIAADFVKEKLPERDQHPEVRPEYCRGLAVDARTGDVYVAVTGNRCVMMVTAQGKATTVLKSEKQWTPTGVDVYDGELYVLEYDDETPTEGRNWPPRVRKLARDGSVVTLVTVRREAPAGSAGPSPARRN